MTREQIPLDLAEADEQDWNKHRLRVVSIHALPDSIAQEEVGREFVVEGVKTPLEVGRTQDKSFYPTQMFAGRMGYRGVSEENGHAYIEAEGIRGTEGKIEVREEMSMQDFDRILCHTPGTEPAWEDLEPSIDFISSRVNADLDRQQAELA